MLTTASARYESKKWIASTIPKVRTHIEGPPSVTEMGVWRTIQDAFNSSSSDCSEGSSLSSGTKDKDVIVSISVGAIDTDMMKGSNERDRYISDGRRSLTTEAHE
jgi:hypothetical protein